MKILWLSNLVFSESPIRTSGTWMSSMGEAIAETGDFALFNISNAKVSEVCEANVGKITQWTVPVERIRSDGLPSKKTVTDIVRIVDSVAPDLIHVWGTENYWGLLTARKYLSQKALLEMQGIKYAIAPVMMGGLSFSEAVGCLGIKEMVRPSCSVFSDQAAFRASRKVETEIIKGHQFISCQSEWVRAHVMAMDANKRLFSSKMMLRKEFLSSKPWASCSHDDSPEIFTSSYGAIPYKGLHVLLRAVAILKDTWPRIRLTVGGNRFQSGIRRSGYARWLLREIKRLGIENHVAFVGPLDAAEMIRHIHGSSVVIIPSFVESYSMALAEAMAVGVPVVASYAGAMPELARDGESVLFFPMGDETMCAWQIRRILQSPSLASSLAVHARELGLNRNNPDDAVRRQIEIYNEVSDSSGRR